ncbi:MAG: hypothetical protein EAY81_09635 [Bacteroidetes bacterium]|nr:MAG: hypothetical protein EAY81_09635 [Bacteroidota bacterium]
MQTATAQIETTLPALSRINQSSYLNPAVLPAYKYSLGIPALSGIGTQLGINGLTLTNVTDNIDDSNRINLTKLHEDIKGNALGVRVQTNIELIHFRFKSKKLYWGIHANNRVISHIDISKDLLGLVINGNTFYTGKTADASNTQITSIAFNEYGVSVARNFNRFNVGVRLKMYQGITAALTDNMVLKQTTPQNPTDPVRVQLGGIVRTSGITYIKDSIGNRKATNDEKETVIPVNFNNMGTGIDLGLTFDVSNKLTLGASVTDLGANIKWKSRTFSYTFNNLDYSFTGLTYDQLRYDSLRDNYLDSVGKLFDFNGADQQFTTAIPTRFFLTANYQLNSKNTIGAMFQGQYRLGESQSAFTVNYTRRLGNRFDITANYSKITNLDGMVGMGLAIKASVFQVYLIQDNILFLMNPSRNVYMNFRFGINFVWGEMKRPVKVY